uniref:Uncharacterized protein n=1 Tax=Desulfobacca acetoxidans TaxID=60893 RepID=A0A7V4G8C0_9BACT
MDLVHRSQPPLWEEAPEGREEGEEPALPLPPAEAGRNNGRLEEQVEELAARLSRLEGLVLDLSHELVPLLGKLAGNRPGPPAAGEETPPVVSPEAPPPEGLAPPPKRRWLPWRR